MFVEALALVVSAIIILSMQTLAEDPSCGLDPQRYILNAQDVNIAVFLDVHQSAGDGCGEINPGAVQELEAISFVFDRLNEANYIPGVNLGFVAYDTCSQPHLAAENLRHLMSKVDNHYVEPSCSNTSETIFGIAGPSTSADAIAMARILAAEDPDDRLIQISHSATATVVTSSGQFNNAYSLVPPDSLQAKVIIELLKELEWNYVALMYTDDAYGSNGAADIMKLSNASGICLAFVEKLSTTRDAAQVQGALNRINMYGGNTRPRTSGVVFFGSAEIADEVLKQATTYYHKLQFIFSDSVQFKPSLFRDHYRVASGALVIEPTFRRIQSLEDHLKKLYSDRNVLVQRAETNPWLEELFRKETNCTNFMTLTKCQQLSDVARLTTTSLFTYYMTQVAFLYAKLMKESCPRTSCLQLDTVSRETIRRNLAELRLSFSGEFGDATVQEIAEGALVFHRNGSRVPMTDSTAVYEVKNLQLKNGPGNENYCLQKVGSFDGSTLSLNVTDMKNYNANETEITRMPAQCPVGSVCEACRVTDAAKHSVYLPGDFIIVAMAPIYDRGPEPFTCSGIRVDKGLQLAQAILFALKKVNEKNGIFAEVFPGKSIGTLILNTCYSESVSLRSALSVFLENEENSASRVKGVASRVLGFVGAVRSDVSEEVANLLTHTKHVQLSYASTSVTLSDHVTYPYFMRNCASDKLQGEIMVMILKHMNWMYVSVVYVDDSYGQHGLEVIQTLARSEGVCIAQAIKVGQNPNYFAVLESLRQTPSSRVVILFLRSTSAKALLEAFSVKNDYQQGEFTFILTESVGNREFVISNAPASLGSISLLQELPSNPDFTNFLSQRKITLGLPEKVWLEEYWEPYFDCYTPTSYNKSRQKVCDPNVSLTDERYQQDPWAPFAINSVFSMVLGAHRAFRDLCGSSEELCSKYRNDPAAVRAEILKTRLDVFATGSRIAAFDDNGDGTVGFAIFNVQEVSPGNRIYKQVGYWSKDKGLSMEKDKLRFPTGMAFPSSECPNEQVCNRCKSGQTSAQNCSDVPALRIVAGVLSSAVFICIIIIIVVVIICRCRSHPPPRETYGCRSLAVNRTITAAVGAHHHDHHHTLEQVLCADTKKTFENKCKGDPEDDYIHALDVYDVIRDGARARDPTQGYSGQCVNLTATGISGQSVRPVEAEKSGQSLSLNDLDRAPDHFPPPVPCEQGI